jgi:hypothetical protein
MRLHKVFLSVTLFGLVITSGLAQQPSQTQTVVPEAIIIQPIQTPLQIRVWTERPSYAPGETLKISFSVNQDANVYIYDISVDGRVTLLFPNAFQPVSFVKAGTYTLPNSNSYSFKVKEPYGIELLQALAVATPLVIPGGQFTPQNPFPQLSLKPKEYRLQMISVINNSVGQSSWAASWAQFVIESREARLTIHSFPEGAAVYINGLYRGETPLQLTVNPGRAHIKLIRDGYSAWEQMVVLQQGTLLPIEVRLNAAPLMPSPARLLIQSEPSGAAVYINGLYRGLTPIEISVTPGYVALQLRREGYESWKTTLTLTPGVIQEIVAQLNPLPVPQPAQPPAEQPSQPPVEQPQPPPTVTPLQPIPTPPTPPEPNLSVTVTVARAALGLNVGLNSAGVVSAGGDFGWRVGAGLISLGTAVSMTEDLVPEFNDLGRSAKFDYGERVYHIGPEVELYIKLSALLFDLFAFEVAGGLAFQERAHIALPPTLGTMKELDVSVVPNGYTSTKTYLLGYAGIGIHLGNLTVSILEHPRRGRVVSVSLHF